jgi:type II secretory pathway component PulF
LIKVGQLSGDLGQAMRHASAIVRRDIEIRQNLWSTFSYPAFVFIALLAGLAVILGVVAPALAPLVAEIAPQKAWFLRLIVGASDWLATSWSVLLVILGGSIAALAASAALGMLGPALDRLLASGPLRRTVAELEYGAWAIGAGRLIATGAPAPQATLGASAFAKNNIVKSDIAHVAARMRDGASLARALAEATCVPPAIARMAQVGESAGALGPMLERGGEQAQARALRRIGRASAVAAPIALLLMGGLIGSIVAGLLTGVASIGDATLQ